MSKYKLQSLIYNQATHILSTLALFDNQTDARNNILLSNRSNRLHSTINTHVMHLEYYMIQIILSMKVLHKHGMAWL